MRSPLASTHKLLTAMIAFGGEVNVLTPEPVSDPENLPATESPKNPPRARSVCGTQRSGSVCTVSHARARGDFVLARTAAAADESKYAAAVEAREAAIPVFAIGPAAPFGRLADSMTADRGRSMQRSATNRAIRSVSSSSFPTTKATLSWPIRAMVRSTWSVFAARPREPFANTRQRLARLGNRRRRRDQAGVATQVRSGLWERGRVQKDSGRESGLPGLARSGQVAAGARVDRSHARLSQR